MSKALFKIFSDGSSFNNGYKNPDLPQFAACGIIITLNEKIIYRGKKGFDDQTISYAELKGAILGLDKLAEIISTQGDKINKPYRVELYSDSQFVVKGKEEWMHNWLESVEDWRTGIWINSQGKEVGQLDLWKELKGNYLDSDDFDITFIHIKGHSKGESFEQKMNNECDKIAGEKIKEMKKKMGLK